MNAAVQSAIRETIAAATYGDPEQDGYGTDDAQGDYAQKLIEAGEVGEVVAELYDAAALLGWIARNVDLPANYLPAFRALIRRSESTFWAVDKLEAAA